MTETYSATFRWPSGPSKVIVTGSFDQWMRTKELTKTDNGFAITIPLPYSSDIQYKYVVDGEWKCNPTEPQANDVQGNRNNVYTTPPKPKSTSALDDVKRNLAGVGTNIAAKDGTSSVFSYVTSGLGAAIATVTGVDPINPQQIAIDSPINDKAAEPEPALKPASPVESIANSAALETVVKQPPKPPIVDTLAPIQDEPVVLKLSPTTQKAPETVPEINGVHISNAPEPYKPTNGTLPAETAPSTAAASEPAPSTTAASEPAEIKPEEAKKVTPPSTPPAHAKTHGRHSTTSDSAPSITASSITTTPRKKRHSIFSTIKGALTPEKKKHKDKA